MAAGGPGINGVRLDGGASPNPADRRRTTRIGSAIRATVRLAEIDNASLLTARTVDISDTGIRLQLRRRLPLGARVLVDLECEVPLRVHLGYDLDALVVDGPMHTHNVRIAGRIARLDRTAARLYAVGIEFCPETTRFDELQAVRWYIDHLREQAISSSY